MSTLTRRNWVTSSIAATSLAASKSSKAAEPVSNKPNIVLVISDQFRADNLGCLGSNPMNLTPNLDALARQGTLFRTAMANQPVCAPARATMFTGQFPEKHGVWHNGPGLPAGVPTLASELRKAGYTANYIGKWHLSAGAPGAVPLESRGGFNDLWEASNALEHTSHAYEGEMFDGDGNPIRFSGTYRTDFLTARAVRFLKEKKTTAPFFLTVSYLETHHQNDLDVFQPPKKYEGQFKNPFVPPDLRPLPGSWPSQLADYYGCVKGIDDAIGTIAETLRAEHLMENTIFVFTSDHGCHFKTRNTEYKRSPHESSIHIPLIICGPGFNKRLEISELVSQVDLAPTLLTAAGVNVPASTQGQKIQALIDRSTDNWQNEVYIGLREFVTGRVLRTQQWSYAVMAPKRSGWRPVEGADLYVEYMLYDNYADPAQQTNLMGRAESRAITEQLRQRLLERIKSAGGENPTIEPAWFPYS